MSEVHEFEYRGTSTLMYMGTFLIKKSPRTHEYSHNLLRDSEPQGVGHHRLLRGELCGV